MSKNSTKKTISAKERLQRLTISAVFIALAVVAKFFQITIPILGTAGMHISAAGIFSTLPALLFGPVYGGTVAGIVDVIGYFMAGGKDGPFVPALTVTAILCGVLKGLFWNLFLKLREVKNWKRIQIIFIAVFSAVLLFGIGNWICVSFLPTFAWTEVLLLLGGKVSYATYGVIIVGGVGIICALTAQFMEKKIRQGNGANVMCLLGTLGVSNLLVTTINTFIIMDLYQIKSAFWVFYPPRLIEELIMIVIQAFVIAWILVPLKKIGGNVISRERI